ncbi:MAG TPA: deoxyguanosinetriphosphate triphosphohydrolase [Acidobacteriota bacterium]|jgi:dGTPase
MLGREDLERLEAERLAPYAALARASRGRRVAEPEAPYRTCYQRDRDRILHCSAFRRLEYKTQVFVSHEGDYYRTRLTHSLEVSQISRTLGRTLRLNEDLMEAVALSHDLGHTPFGHAGERVLQPLMKGHGGFEHNLQSFRIVELLERRYPHCSGLNLTYELREGILKHSLDFEPERIPTEYEPQLNPPLEIQLVDLADEIGYNNHDLDDGITASMIPLDQLEQVELWREHFGRARQRHPDQPFAVLKHQAIAWIIADQVEDLARTTAARLEEREVSRIDQVRDKRLRIPGFSPAMAERHRQLKQFLWDHLYQHPKVLRMEQKARRVLTDLFQAYLDCLQALPERHYNRIQEGETPERVICDYIAGMTDRFALDEHRKLFDPQQPV